jgi:glycosyltransferase involved in cell wall biosynthesis
MRKSSSSGTVLIFAPRFPPRRGGSATYFSNVVKSLSDRYDFIVLTFYRGDEPITSRSDGYLVIRAIPFVDILPAVPRTVIESGVSFFITIYLYIRFEINVVHLHAGSFATPGITVASSIWRTPILYDCRDEMFPPWLVRIGLTPIWFSCAPNVDTILKQNGIPEERIVRAPVSNPEYVGTYAKSNPGARSGTEFQVIFVGRMIEEKGIFLLLDAFEEFANVHPDTRLVLVGDDPTGDIERRVRNSCLDEQVTLTGEIPHREAIQNMAESDVLVLPSSDEALPRVIVEAFEVGVPVVATPVGEVPNVVSDGDTGILIDEKPESIVSALNHLYRNKEVRQRIAVNAQETSQEWNNLTEQLSKAYDQVID